jgi:hypothetical protein
MSTHRTFLTIMSRCEYKHCPYRASRLIKGVYLCTEHADLVEFINFMVKKKLFKSSKEKKSE